MRARVVLLVLLVLAVADGRAAERPQLQLRASPPAALPPVNVLFVAELVGGDEVEELYCPEVEWEFEDGSRSRRQSDCEPFDETSELERRYLARRSYSRPGEYRVTFTLRRSEQVVARASTTVYLSSPGSEGYTPFSPSQH